MDALKFRCRPDPIDEDLDEEVLTPKILDFDSADHSFDEPKCSKVVMEIVQVVEVALEEISPVPSRKRKVQTTLSPDFFKGLRIEPPRKRLSTLDMNTSSAKRRMIEKPTQRLSPPLSSSLPFAVRKRDTIGDGSKKLLLPTIKGSKPDLKYITPDTLTAVLRKQAPYDNIDTCLVDCRYPYEYVAGHIRGFQNIFLPEDVRAHFLKKLNHQNVSACRRTILIFHCEFSSKRAPDLVKLLRREDRKANEAFYPALHYPEIYLLHGGYKAFFERYRSMCDPPFYKPMSDGKHKEELSMCEKNVRLQMGVPGGTVAKTALSRRCQVPSGVVL